MENVSFANFFPRRYEYFRWGVCFWDLFDVLYHLFVLAVLFFLGLKVLDVSWKDILPESGMKSGGKENERKLELCSVCGKRETAIVEEGEEDHHDAEVRQGAELNDHEELGSLQRALRMVSSELEEERNAASSAAEAAMSMILKLQNEKSLIQMDARQYRVQAERKQVHDAQTIEYLKWVIQKYEPQWNVEEADSEFLEEILCRRVSLGRNTESYEECTYDEVESNREQLFPTRRNLSSPAGFVNCHSFYEVISAADP